MMVMRAIALFGSILMVAGLSGCEDAVLLPAPEAPVQVQVHPAGPLELQVGDTLRLQMTVSGGRSEDLLLTSSSPSVASVSDDGLISALSRGTTTISVAPRTAAGATAAVFVRVSDDEPPAVPDASAIIHGISTGTGSAVDPESVGGTIVVTGSVRRGAGAVAQVLLGGVIACEQPLTSPPASLVALSCTIRTDRYDEATGAATFLNGIHALILRVVDEGGTPLAAAGGAQLRLRNQSHLAVSVNGTEQATGPDGATWHGGDLQAEALPVLYEAGALVQRVTFTHQLSSGEPLIRISDGAPFTVTFDSESLGHIQSDSFAVSANGILQSGGSVSGTSSPIRVDLVPPPAGSLRSTTWVGASTLFAALHVPVEPQATGVGGITRSFLAGARDASTADLLASGREVRAGSDLEDSGSSAYRVIALVCDALENCSTTSGFNFGVDTRAPRIVSASIPMWAINPARDISLGLEDGGSGFGDRPLEVFVEALRPGRGVECGPVVEGIELPGRLSGGVCVPDTTSAVIPVPHTTSGYYSYTIVARDRAGNATAPFVRTVLVDQEAPAVTAFTTGSDLAPGRDIVASASAADNLDVRDLTFSIVFAAAGGSGRTVLPFAPTTSLGVPFEGGLTASGSATATFPFVRSLTTGSGAAATRATVLADSLEARVRDAAGLTARAVRALPSSSGGSADPFSSVVETAVAIGATAICTQDCLSSDPTSTTLSLQLKGGLGLQQPFERVYLYRRDGAGRIHLLGTTSTFRQDDVLGSRTLTYTFSYEPQAGLQGEQKLLAVGVAGQSRGGAALAWNEVDLTLFRR